MVNTKKAQISMNMIVYVSVALLVLVLIVAFATGGLGKAFKGLSTQSKGEVELLKDKCTITCENTKTSVSVSGTSAWSSSTYCTEEYGLDRDSSGTLEDTEFFNCWESPIGVSCATTIQSAGSRTTLDEKSCPAHDNYLD